MGGLGPILRNANGLIIWDSDGPALLETQMKAKSCESRNPRGQFGATVEFYSLVRARFSAFITIHLQSAVSGLPKTCCQFCCSDDSIIYNSVPSIMLANSTLKVKPH